MAAISALGATPSSAFTWTDSVAKLTVALTPAIEFKAPSILLTQEEHVIPLTLKV
jgi:hypothetical protein